MFFGVVIPPSFRTWAFSASRHRKGREVMEEAQLLLKNYDLEVTPSHFHSHLVGITSLMAMPAAGRGGAGQAVPSNLSAFWKREHEFFVGSPVTLLHQ